MSSPQIRTVAVSEWIAHHRDLADAGLGFFDMIAATDLGDQRVELVSHVMRVDASERAMVRIEVDLAEPVPSLVHVYPAAAWHEREAHDTNGVVFDGNLDLRVLITDAQPPPLQRTAMLEPRVATPWPGLYEPGAAEGETRRRRPKPVPGVNEEWLSGGGQ